MPSLSQPRSLSKTMAIAAISLLAAGFLTVLGIGLRGLLWEIRTSQAEMQKAQAEMNQANAAMQNALAALEQARATVTAAQKHAEGLMGAAERQAVGNVEGQRVGNIAEYENTTKVMNPLINDPVNQITVLAKTLGSIDGQLEKGRNVNGDPLTEQERNQLQEKRQKIAFQLELAQRELRTAANATLSVGTSVFGDFAKSFMDGLKTSKPAPVQPASDPVINKPRSFAQPANEAAKPAQQVEAASAPATNKPEPTSDPSPSRSVGQSQERKSFVPAERKPYVPLERKSYDQPTKFRSFGNPNPEVKKSPEP